MFRGNGIAYQSELVDRDGSVRSVTRVSSDPRPRAQPYRRALPAARRRGVRAHLRAGGRCGAVAVVDAQVVRRVAVVSAEATAAVHVLRGRAVPAGPAVRVDV